VTLLAFSSIEVTAHPIRHRIDPFALNCWRFLLGGAIVLPFALLRSGGIQAVRAVTRSDWLRLFGLGFLNIVLAMGAFGLSIKYSKASTAAILIAANPLATNFFARVLVGETLKPGRIAALILGLAGVILVTLKPAPGEDSWFGMSMGLLGMCGFSLYTVLARDIVRRLGGITVTACSFAAGNLLNLLILGGLGIPLWPAEDLWPRLLILGFFVSGLGYVTFFQVLSAVPAGKASLLFFLKPPLATLLAWLLLNEAPTPLAAVGGLIVMSGILIDLLSRES
jgi:drug/metabolite transporter (DMT)-like permease